MGDMSNPRKCCVPCPAPNRTSRDNNTGGVGPETDEASPGRTLEVQVRSGANQCPLGNNHNVVLFFYFLQVQRIKQLRSTYSYIRHAVDIKTKWPPCTAKDISLRYNAIKIYRCNSISRHSISFHLRCTRCAASVLFCRSGRNPGSPCACTFTTLAVENSS